MSKTLRQIINLSFAFLLAVMSVNLSGVLTLTNAYAANNGTLKVHEKGTASGTESNDPKVCVFNFEGFSFDKDQSGYIVIETQPGGVSSLSPSTLPFGPANNSGYAATAYVNDGGTYSLPVGQYKATLYGKSVGNPSVPNYNDEKAKSKVFKVDCTMVTPTAPTQADPCGTNNDTYTIPSKTGVIYKVNGTTKAAGTYAASGTVTITAVAANQDYLLQGTTTWTFTFSNTACATPVTPAAPTVSKDECGTANDTFTIPSKTGVDYYVNGTLTAAGTYSTNGALSIAITAVAKQGYVLTGTTSWALTFTNSPCPVEVTPPVPTKYDACGKSNDMYTIPSKTGVIYKVNGTVKAAGTYQTNTDVTITAVAANGYVLTGTTSWNFDFSQRDCSVTPTDPTKIDECGTDNDTYTIPSKTGVVYKVNGVVKAAGTYHGTGTIMIHADPAPGYDFPHDTQDGWTFKLSSKACPQPCHQEQLVGITTFNFNQNHYDDNDHHHDDDEDDDCIPVSVTPADPTSNDSCGTADDSYTIPYKAGVSYKVNGVTKAAGTYKTNGASSITITAVAQAGYTLSGTKSWTFTFDTTACPISVTPITPTTVDECGTDDDGYIIPQQAGVIYKVNGVTVGEGFHPTTGSVTITAVAEPGYALSGTTKWTFDEFTDEACEEPNPCEPSVVPVFDLERVLSQETPVDPCTPGMGNAGGSTDSTTPTPTPTPTPKSPLELPQTGPEERSTFTKLVTIAIAGISTYVVLFFIVNRRELYEK